MCISRCANSVLIDGTSVFFAFDINGLVHTVKNHALEDAPFRRQFRRQFECVIDPTFVGDAAGARYCKHPLSFVGFGRALCKLFDADLSVFYSYRLFDDYGNVVDFRVNALALCGLIGVFSRSNGWSLVTAYYTHDRDVPAISRRDALRNDIRKHLSRQIRIGSRLVLLFDPKRQYRSKRSDGSYAIQTDFVLSNEEAFGVCDMNIEGINRRVFDLTKIPQG